MLTPIPETNRTTEHARPTLKSILIRQMRLRCSLGVAFSHYEGGPLYKRLSIDPNFRLLPPRT